jgi:hypothetical protein
VVHAYNLTDLVKMELFLDCHDLEELRPNVSSIWAGEGYVCPEGELVLEKAMDSFNPGRVQYDR